MSKKCKCWSITKMRFQGFYENTLKLEKRIHGMTDIADFIILTYKINIWKYWNSKSP